MDMTPHVEVSRKMLDDLIGVLSDSEMTHVAVGLEPVESSSRVLLVIQWTNDDESKVFDLKWPIVETFGDEAGASVRG